MPGDFCAIIIYSNPCRLAAVTMGVKQMLGKFIADMIMLPRRTCFGDNIDYESKEGFSEAIKDYYDKWDKHNFYVKSGDINIVGEYVINPKAADTKRVCVICHGQTVDHCPDIKYGKIFYDLGFHLVLFDHRYFGGSGGRYCTLGWKENEDIKEVLKFTRKTFGEDAVIGLHGESMGAASELIMLNTEKPAFVIADCPFSDLGRMMDELAKQRAGFLGKAAVNRARHIGLKRCGFDLRAVRPIDSVRISEVPICFIHGEDDSLIAKYHSERMYKECKNPMSEIHIVKGAEHARSIYVDPKGYQKICESFIQKVLKA